MARETIASANIEINLDDDAVVAGLHRIDREFQRTVSAIDHTRATAKADLDTSPFEDAVTNIKREIKELQGKHVTKTLDMDDKAYQAKMKALRKELKDVEGQKATVELDVKGEQKVLAAREKLRRAAEAETKAIENREKARARVMEQAEARRLLSVRNQARVSASLWKQQEREMSSARTEAERLDRLRDKEIASIPKLQREYAELTQKTELLAAAKRKAARDETAVVTIDFKIAEAEAKMIALHKTLERLGSPVNLSVNIRPGENFGKTVRDEFVKGGLTGAAFLLGAGIGDHLIGGIRSTFSPKAVRGAIGGTLGRIGSALGALSDATVRLGPFTATIRQAILALSVLGPTLLDLVGAAGALVGVLGTGLVGASALAVGAVGALGVSLGGIGFLLPSLLRDFKNLDTLQGAYHKQVLKTGEGSDKAKTKLKEYEHALGAVLPTTKAAFLSLDALQDKWRGLAQEAKPDFFNIMGEAIQTVNTHFEWFRRNTLKAFSEVRSGWADWMSGLRSPEAIRILDKLGDAGNKSIVPLMHSLGNIATMLGRIAESSSRFLPGLIKDFDTWTESLKDSEAMTTNLDSNIDRLVEHTASLVKFLKAGGEFLASFFDAGADSGAGFLDVMTETLEGWTRFNESVAGRAKLVEFFDRSVEGARALYNALAPIVASFVTWAAEMSPLITQFLKGAAAVSSTVAAFLKLTGLQNSLSAVVTTLGALWAVSRIRAATRAVQGFGGALLGLKSPAAAAGGINIAGGLGAGGRIVGPAERTMANAIKTTALSAVKGAGLLGVGVMAMELIGKGMQTAAARGGTSSTMLGLSRDVLSTLSFGLVSSAEESSKAAAKKVVGSLRKNINLELNKNIKLGGGTSTLDLTIDQKKTARNFQMALQAADRIAREHKLPTLSTAVRVKSNPADFRTIQQNFDRLKNNLATSNASIRRNSDETLQAVARSMDTNTREGQIVVERNMSASALAITRSMGTGKHAVSEAMQEIRHQFKVNSEASKRSAETNFGAAKSAIQMAVKDGKISSERGLAEIRKLWVSYLKLYGFSEKEARNISKGQSYTGGPEEGSAVRTINNKKAKGGLSTVGRKGQVGPDSVPMNLGGVPSVVAPGEQIAVFNRHQQKKMAVAYPGGLEGFFSGPQRAHNYAGGGIVPVPGFPGERAASSILDEIAMVHDRWGLTLTDAYGSGHKSPGHTQFGTAADFSGPDRAMDAAVQALVGAGYLVGYDGRFGSQAWPGHGPSYVAGSNAHLHVEFGGKGGGAVGGGAPIEAQTIERQMVKQGLGAVTSLTQAAVDIVREAAQSNLDAVAQQSLSIAVAGGGGGGQGAPEGQVKAWIEAGLRLAGISPGGGNVGILYGRVMQESGGNPRAQNNWDSNAKAGHPSKGILQTIDSTFNAYKVPGHNDIWNPVDNIAAAVRYMMGTYGHLVGRSSTGYAHGGIVSMPENMWMRGGKIDRPTLMTGEDGKRSPEYVVGTNPRFRSNNIQALTNAARALGVPMARSSKTGTIKPSFVNGSGRDPENLREVKSYANVQQREEDKRREISIAESKVKEPDTLIKQQGTDALGNPLYVVDQAKVNAYVAMMKTVKDLYDDLINKIMVQLADAAGRAFEALQIYRNQRTQNIQELDNQNAVNKRLMRSKDKHTREAAERRYNAGLEMRGQQLGLRNDAEVVRDRIRDDQKDASFRVQEYGVSRQSVVDDIVAVGSKAAADAASETKSAFQEPDKVTVPTAGEAATQRLETEYALAQAGYGMNGQLGGQRDVSAIINDLIAANELRITEAQGMLTDADTTNDQDAYAALTQAANAIKGFKDELGRSVPNMAEETATLGGAILDLYKSFGGNFSLAQSGLSAGNHVAASMSGSKTGSGMLGTSGAIGGAGLTVHIEQSFPEQPDPVTWAAATNYELNAAL